MEKYKEVKKLGDGSFGSVTMAKKYLRWVSCSHKKNEIKIQILGWVHGAKGIKIFIKIKRSYQCY